MSDNMDKQTVDWHSGFYGAVRFEFRNEPFTFERELLLNERPIQIDVLIGSKKGYKSRNKVASIFRQINIVEYKSPQDALNYRQFYKTLAYASLYVSNKLVPGIEPNDITVSIFRDTYTKGLFKYLKNNGYTVEKPSKGIYYINGNIPFPLQVVITSELPKMEYLALKVLTNRLDVQEASAFIDIAKELVDENDKDNVDAVLQVSVNVNDVVYDAIRRSDAKMCEALRRLMRDELIEAENKGAASRDAEVKALIDENKKLKAEIAAMKKLKN